MKKKVSQKKTITQKKEKKKASQKKEEEKSFPSETNETSEEVKLTPKQKIFCEEYLVDLNALRAAKAAGYSEKTAGVIANENLNKPYINAYIQKRMDERADKLEISKEKIIHELAKIAFSNVTDFSNWKNNNVTVIDSDALGEETGAIKEISSQQTEYGSNIKLKMHSKLTALELLSRHLDLDLARQKKQVVHSGNISMSLEDMTDEQLMGILDDSSEEEEG